MTRSFPVWTLFTFLIGNIPVLGESPGVLLPPDLPIEQVVDHYIAQGLKAGKINPAPPADSATLLRRLTLDLNGRIPTFGELADFLADNGPDKKTKLVDRLLASPAFPRHQTNEFLALMLPGDLARRQKNGSFRDYLAKCFAENRPWDRVFREVMLPDETKPATKGSSEFLRTRIKDLNRLTIDVSTVFFGVNISCAQCHDHPHVHDWKQDHFYGMKSFFARTFEANGKLGERGSGVVKFIPNKGKEKVAPVMFLTGKTIAVPEAKEKEKPGKKKGPAKITPPGFSLRSKLADVALEPGQRDFFSRAIVNRLWYRFFGRGLVMPLDQMHSENPPSHPELLQWLARDLVDHGYDLRRLVRGLVLSKAYARSSRREGELPPENAFALARIRPLTTNQMAFSLHLACADPDSLKGDLASREKKLQGLEKSAQGLTRLFPQPAENFQVGVAEAMLFANNEGLQKELLEGTGKLTSRLVKTPLEKRADLAVRCVLGRPATPEESKAMTDYLSRRPDRPEAACQQVVWALLTSAEFRFNH